MNIKNLIGDVPEVPVKVTVENETIIKICVAVVMVAAIIILFSKVFKK
jgi:hypothetical protein